LSSGSRGGNTRSCSSENSGRNSRAADPVFSAHLGDVGPRKTNAPGRRRQVSPPPQKVERNRRQEHTTSREPLPAVDIPALVERACAEREATLLAQFEGLMRKHMASQTISPVRSSSRRPAVESEQEQRPSEGRSRREATAQGRSDQRARAPSAR
jgi:hypothetical protein